MAQAPEVVVVGAGIVGASIAWHLTAAGAAVTVIDAGEPGGIATAGSFAWINASWGNPEHYFRLRVHSMAGWRRLAEAVPAVPIAWVGGLCWDLPRDQLLDHARKHGSWGYGVRSVNRHGSRPDRAAACRSAGHCPACPGGGGRRAGRCRPGAVTGRPGPWRPTAAGNAGALAPAASGEDRRRRNQTRLSRRRRGRPRGRGRHPGAAGDGRARPRHERAARTAGAHPPARPAAARGRARAGAAHAADGSRPDVFRATRGADPGADPTATAKAVVSGRWRCSDRETSSWSALHRVPAERLPWHGRISRHRPARRLLAVDVAREHPILQQRLVLLAAVAGIRPDPSRRIARIEQLAEPRPGMRRGIGHGPAPDQPVASIGTDMVLVAERRDRDVDRV